MSAVRVIASTRLHFQISAFTSNVKAQSMLFALEMASHHRDQDGRIIGP
jgi:hypothetical protein